MMIGHLHHQAVLVQVSHLITQKKVAMRVKVIAMMTPCQVVRAVEVREEYSDPIDMFLVKEIISTIALHLHLVLVYILFLINPVGYTICLLDMQFL